MRTCLVSLLALNTSAWKTSDYNAYSARNNGIPYQLEEELELEAEIEELALANDDD